jgi:hypothetical protein
VRILVGELSLRSFRLLAEDTVSNDCLTTPAARSVAEERGLARIESPAS